MSRILFTIRLPNDDRHIRKKLASPEKVIKDVKTYSRKRKHKKDYINEETWFNKD